MGVRGAKGEGRTGRGFSIRQHLMLLVLAVMLPFVALHAYVLSRHVDHDMEQAHSLVQRYAVLGAADTAHFLSDTAATLHHLATHATLQHPAEACSHELGVVVSGNPNFTSASIVTLPFGAVICSSLPSGPGRMEHMFPRRFAESVALSNNLAVSDPFFDRAGGQWMIAFAYPVPREGQARNAVVLTINLLTGPGLHYRTSLVGELLPPGSTNTVIDSNKRVLARWPDAAQWVGKQAEGIPIIDYVRTVRTPGHVISRGLDGQERVYGYAPVVGTGWWVYLGIPTAVAIAPARNFMWRDTMLGLAVTFFVTLLAAVVGTYIARPVRALARTAHKATEGDVAARAPVVGPSEIRDAAQGFNRLLGETRRAEAALSEEKRQAEITLHSIGDSVVRVDRDQHITFLNPAAERLTGWPLSEAFGRPLFDVVVLKKESTREVIRKSLDHVLRDGTVVDISSDTLLVARNGKEYDVADSAAALLDPVHGVVGAVLVFRDISETRELQRRLSWQARHDALTGLVNRVEFEHRVVEALDDAGANTSHHVLLYVDLDQFKVVNDTAGHLAGDELLRRLADMLKIVVGAEHTVARVGGDEFCVLLRNESLEGAERIADRLRRAIQDFLFVWEDHTFNVGASIGLVKVDASTGSLEDAMNAADIACYAAKERGRNRVHVFVPEDQDVRERVEEPEWVRRINKAFEEQRFRLYEQAIVPTASGSRDPILHEILVRMCDENGRLLQPSSFLPTAKRYHLLTTLDRWVVSTAFSRMSKNKNDVSCCINLTGHSISDDRFLQFVQDQFDATGLAPQRVCFEITESAVVLNLGHATRFMQELRRKGVRFALDDFGIGISSLAYLRSLPVDLIKIDGRFVRNIDRDDIDRAMVEAIIRIGEVMHLKTVGEFVESERTRTILQVLGVDYVQGYGVSEPQPIERILAGEQVVEHGRV